MHVIVADDHPLYREAVRLRLLRLYTDAAVTEAASVDDLLALAPPDEGPFELILVDLRMPGMDGGASIRRVVVGFPDSAVVLMSGEATSEDVRAAIQAGARGFIPKTIASDLFSSAVRIIADGGTYLPSDVLSAEPVEREPPVKGMIERLTPRQQQVLVRLTGGASNKEIGRDLGLSEITVKLHVRAIFKKIGVRNRAEATAVAIKGGLI
jgi:two-component system nitrate/nitrite response regulator NarL